MTTPDLRVELATDGGPFTASPTWTTLPATDVLGFSMVEGRTSPTAQTTTPSTCSISFDNSLRLYDPTHTAGTYFTSLKPGRQMRVTAVEADLTETVLFRGVVGVEGWQQVDYRHPATSRAVVQCVDWLGALAVWPDDLPPFESYLRRLAVDYGLWGGTSPGVLHWPLDDSDGWSGRQTFNDPVDNTDVQSPYGVRRYYQRGSASIEVSAAGVHSDVVLRPGLGGSVDSNLGLAQLEPTGILLGAVASDQYYVTYGFAFRLRSVAPVDTAPIAATDTGHGWYLDRNGELKVTFNAGATYLSTATSGTRLELGRTYFIATTWDGTTLSLYIDGVLDVADTHTAYAGTLATVLHVGGDLGDSTGPLLNACDAFAIATPLTATEIGRLYTLWTGFDGVLTGVAAGTLLDSLGVPNGCEGGRVGLEDKGDGVGPLSILQPIERTELGRLYVDHRNEQVDLVRFEELATGTRHTTEQAVFSDQSADVSSIRYSNPVLVNLPPVNSVTASNSTAGFTLTDQTSITAYGVHPATISLASGSGADPLAVAQHLLDLNPDPKVAVSSVTVQPTSAATFGQTLDLELFDLVTVNRQPHNVGSVVSTLMLLEGRSLTISDGAQTWESTYFLREWDDYSWWLWGAGEFEASAGLYGADDNGARLGP